MSFMINEQTPMSEDTTSLCPSVSSLSTQTSMDSDARSPHIGTITSVSRTGFPKSSTTNRRAPATHSRTVTESSHTRKHFTLTGCTLLLQCHNLVWPCVNIFEHFKMTERKVAPIHSAQSPLQCFSMFTQKISP